MHHCAFDVFDAAVQWTVIMQLHVLKDDGWFGTPYIIYILYISSVLLSASSWIENICLGRDLYHLLENILSSKGISVSLEKGDIPITSNLAMPTLIPTLGYLFQVFFLL